MGMMASQITSLTIVYSILYSGADQRKYRRSVSLAFVRGIHRWSLNSPHIWPVTRKMFPFDDVIMYCDKQTIGKNNIPVIHCVTTKQSGRSPKVVALFSATNFSSYITKLLQLHDKIKIKWNYAWIHCNICDLMRFIQQIHIYILHQTYDYHLSHAAG